MSSLKKFKLSAEQIEKLIPSMGYCFATNRITVDGMPVQYMCREVPEEDGDSGWQFFAGTETEEYLDNSDNVAIYDVNTIANYDKAIIPYLNLPYGSRLERIENEDEFSITEDD